MAYTWLSDFALLPCAELQFAVISICSTLKTLNKFNGKIISLEKMKWSEQKPQLMVFHPPAPVFAIVAVFLTVFTRAVEVSIS